MIVVCVDYLSKMPELLALLQLVSCDMFMLESEEMSDLRWPELNDDRVEAVEGEASCWGESPYSAK